MKNRPDWWSWEIEISSHIEKRMAQRDFNEIDLRTMLDSAKKNENDIEDGRLCQKSDRGAVSGGLNNLKRAKPAFCRAYCSETRSTPNPYTTLRRKLMDDASLK